MHLKCETLLLLSFIFFISYTRPTEAYCSLERMKKFAIEACEHLFLQDETREKRSIDFRPNQIGSNGFGDSKKHSISRGVYPPGGYLKVNRERFHKLSQVDVYPRYKPKKVHMDKHERFKREHLQRFEERYDNISYCCFNRCEEDFFC